MKKRSLNKQIAIVIFITVAGYILTYLMSMNIARLLPPHDYGDFAIALLIATFWSKISGFGGPQSLLKFIPRYLKERDKHRVLGMLFFYFMLAIVIGFGIAIVGVLGIGIHLLFFPAPQEHHPMILALWLLPLMAIVRLTASFFRTQERFIYSQTPFSILVPSAALFFIWMVKAFDLHFTDWYAITLMGCAYLVTMFITLFSLFRSGEQAVDFKQKTDYDIKHWLHYSIPIMLSSIFVLTYKQINFIMLEILDPKEADVGFYAAALKISEFLYVAYTSISVIIQPKITNALHEGKKSAQALLDYSITVLSMAIIPICAILIIFRKVILSTFGPEYVTAEDAAMILTTGFGISAILTMNMVFLQFAEFQKTALRIQIAALIAGALLNFIFIPRWGLLGIAISTASIQSGMMIVSMIHVYLKLGLRPFPIPFLRKKD